MRKQILLIPVFIVLICVTWLRAQNEAPDITLANPANTMHIHLYYLQADTYLPDSAARALPPGLDPERAKKMAIQLKQVLDGMGLYVHLNLLPNQNDYQDSISGQYFYTPFPKELPQVYLEKKDSLWYYALATIEDIPALHKTVYPFGVDRLINLLPVRSGRKVFGLNLWQYLGILILGIIAFFLHKLLNQILKPVIRRIFKSKYFEESVLDKRMIYRIAQAASYVLIAGLLRVLLPVLQLPIEIGSVGVLLLRILMTVFFVVLALRILDLLIAYAERYARQTDNRMDEQVIPIVNRTIAIFIVLGGVFQILNLLDVNVTALIAGISIGGLALALAAQDTVKNLIGSAMIFMDRPFQIGDYISTDGMSGTIEEVGFRTTRLRQVDNSVISIPNGTISNSNIVNFGVRDSRMFGFDIGLTYESPVESLQEFVEGCKQLIQAHPQTLNDRYLVHFKALNASSMDVVFRTYINVETYGEEMIVREEILYGIVQLCQACGLDFAFPSKTVYLRKEDPEKPESDTKVSSNEDQGISDLIEKYRGKIQQRIDGQSV